MVAMGGPDPVHEPLPRKPRLIGITEIAIAMANMKRSDLNGRDSKGATPLIWGAKYTNCRIVKLLLEQPDIDPTLSDKRDLTALINATMAGG